LQSVKTGCLARHSGKSGIDRAAALKGICGGAWVTVSAGLLGKKHRSPGKLRTARSSGSDFFDPIASDSVLLQEGRTRAARAERRPDTKFVMGNLLHHAASISVRNRPANKSVQRGAFLSYVFVSNTFTQTSEIQSSDEIPCSCFGGAWNFPIFCARFSTSPSAILNLGLSMKRAAIPKKHYRTDRSICE
jgi:hypothetical protein